MTTLLASAAETAVSSMGDAFLQVLLLLFLFS